MAYYMGTSPVYEKKSYEWNPEWGVVAHSMTDIVVAVQFVPQLKKPKRRPAETPLIRHRQLEDA